MLVGVLDAQAAGTPNMRDCPEAPIVAHLLDAGDLVSAQAQLQDPRSTMSESCLSLQIHLAMRLGAWQIADAHLDDYLQRHSDDAGAWLDLAIVRQRLGDQQASEELLTVIEERFNPSTSIKKLIGSLRQNTPVAAPAATRQRLAIQIIHDSNANLGLSTSQLSINFGQGIQNLLIDPTYRPRADWATQIQYQADGAVGLGKSSPNSEGERQGAPLEWQFLARLKNYQNETAFNTQQFQLDLRHPLQAAPIGFMLRGQLRQDDLGDAGHVGSLRAGIAHITRPAMLPACRTQTSLDWESRRYSANRQLDSHLYWLGAEAACNPTRFPQTTLQASLRLGQDRPQESGRAGGEIRLDEIGATLTQIITPRWLAALSLLHARIRDQSGYSALLQDNAPRTIRRQQIQLAIQFQWQPNVTLYALAEEFHQDANIELFVTANRSLSLGILRHW